jgi:quercetin dioxygenase-like cupin family protein
MMRRTLAIILLVFAVTAAGAEHVIPLATHDLPNVPGRRLTAVVVEYPPGAKSEAHRHAGSAFIFAYVLEGAVRSQLEGEATARVYKVGENWFEAPGAHHIVSENASADATARLLAVFIVAPGERLTTPDPKEK